MALRITYPLCAVARFAVQRGGLPEKASAGMAMSRSRGAAPQRRLPQRPAGAFGFAVRWPAPASATTTASVLRACVQHAGGRVRTAGRRAGFSAVSDHTFLQPDHTIDSRTLPLALGLPSLATRVPPQRPRSAGRQPHTDRGDRHLDRTRNAPTFGDFGGKQSTSDAADRANISSCCANAGRDRAPQTLTGRCACPHPLPSRITRPRHGRPPRGRSTARPWCAARL